MSNPHDESSPRFAFGNNWAAFLGQLDQSRLDEAIKSLQTLLEVDTLAGRRFLDIGSGSGLFSLAAHLLHADVTSIDVDRQSVACTEQLRAQATGAGCVTSGDSLAWEVRHGSVLDESFMVGLGEFDVVYAWGALHHTGSVMRAIELAADRVAPGGRLVIAIYHDQGGGSRRWLAIKRGYHRLPRFLQPVYVAVIAGAMEVKFSVARLASGRNPLPFVDWRAKKADRGMSVWHDWVDWIGGLPFEVARPEAVIVPLRRRGFTLETLRTVGNGWGCNEYVFSRDLPKTEN